MYTILVTDHPGPDTQLEAAMLGSIGGRLIVAQTGSEDELVTLVSDADAILTCFREVTRRVVAAGPNLRVIGRYGVGVDNIAVDFASERRIVVTNVPVYCVDEVAEHAIALLLTLVRRTATYDASVRSGAWRLDVGIPIHRLAGSVLGVVGFGHIGRAVADRGRALGMRIVVSDRSATATEVSQSGATLGDLDYLLSVSDAVSLHVPLNGDTHHLIDARRIALMKPTSFLINCARGPIVDLEALTVALQDGQIAGAGIDVFEPERLPVDHPLVSLRNTVLTPHVAFYSEESIAELQRRATQNVMTVLTGGIPEHIVNAPILGKTSGEEGGA